jgi:hypothetical protein
MSPSKNSPLWRRNAVPSRDSGAMEQPAARASREHSAPNHHPIQYDLLPERLANLTTEQAMRGQRIAGSHGSTFTLGRDIGCARSSDLDGPICLPTGPS